MEMTPDDAFIIAYYQQALADRDMQLATEKSKSNQLEKFIRENFAPQPENPVPTPTDPE